MICELKCLLTETQLIRISTRQRFHCGCINIFGFGKNVSIAIKIVLLNKFVKNYWQ